MSTHDLLQTEAVLDEEEDESFGEEGGQSKDVEENGHYDDSSEEELDDEDEDAVRAVREGFIVDEEEEDEERTARRREKKKRRRQERICAWAFGRRKRLSFALEMEDEEEEQEEDEEKQLDLKDVFEPSQLAEKMMTDEDNIIRSTDEPERYQLARKPYQHVTLTKEQFREEAVWISNLMLLKKRLDSDLHEPFQRAVAKVLEFMVTDDWEVPFIFQHRKDYLIHAVKIPIPDGGTNPDGGKYIVEAEKLLSMIDLWDIFEYDLKFRALIDKRNTLQTTYDNLQTISNVKDEMFEEMLPAAITMEELQDVQDYLYFQYSIELKDIALATTNHEGENGTAAQRRKASTKTFFERVRNSRAYGLVRAFGITPDAFAQNVMETDPRIFARRPELFLRMLKAEEEGLVDIKVHFKDFDNFKKRLYPEIQSDNSSEVADAWNKERKDVLDLALSKLEKIMSKGVKENIRSECENHVARECREVFSTRLDQAPYKPKGMILGTIPRVLALTNGSGIVGKDPIYWTWVEEDGRVLEHGKFVDLTLGDPDRMIADGKDVEAFVELVERRKPDVIGVSGQSPETRKLYKQLSELVQAKDLRGAFYTDERDEEVSDILEVVIVNDEVARLYQTSRRAEVDHPGFSLQSRYCVALAKYLQNPMKEYASLGRDVVSIQFRPGQQLIPQDKLLKQLETALVDMVNLVGVDINEAVSDVSTANLLTYISGLGPRKASQLLKVINMNGGVVNSRMELLGVNAQYPAMGVKVWNNCASFLYIDYDNADPDTDYLDNTRVHPEDYDIGRKIAADALELDEEDIKAETDENGQGAIVRKLIKEDAQDKVNDLLLEEYAEQLENNLNQRKRATLETIRAELQQPYEELRKQFVFLGTDAIFTMFTGETAESLAQGMIVPITIKRVSDDHIDGKLDCGIGALVPESEMTDRYDIPIRSLYAPHQTTLAKITYLNRKSFVANVSLREDQVNKPYRRQLDHMRGEWDEDQEREDQEAMKEKTQTDQRALRVIKHPLFRPFNGRQAEEFLAPQSRGDVVIRPSSKGHDHLAVTWKVADGVYQHIDVLELDKDNEFTVGRILKIGGKYSYTDLDELIVNHVKAMAKKVDDMTVHEKYQSGTKEATEGWLTTYTTANPKRSAYAFCLDTKHPGYFHLCFKAGLKAPLNSWPVKVIPQGYELQRTPYPDMRALCNGFKLLHANMLAAQQRRGR
ncbi:transcription elongation factor spt6 [Trichophyton tonsurans CBS 112818]|uniref:Transcription elongation factor Spt6 n=1 Tax=Trichophyton tonsurans (strain CBS 112818) TaxID=647933 RepID=F2RSR5_TRIT1|nr:transcription elongation factor spt6 [Trichophyton tonsurans CBS 112818]